MLKSLKEGGLKLLLLTLLRFTN